MQKNVHPSDRAHLGWGKDAHTLEGDHDWGLRLVRASAHMEQIAEMVYLAIVSLCGVETDQGNYYIQESGQARNRVDLQKETGMATKRESKMFIITDQYCPAIGSTTSDDIPFIVKSGDELPARGGAESYLLRHIAGGTEDSTPADGQTHK